jgi:hypothetical protein
LATGFEHQFAQSIPDSCCKRSIHRSKEQIV